MYISVGSIIVDDIVLPDGVTRMGEFGGGAAHAVSGMRVWSDQVGLTSWLGQDFPSSMYDQLRSTCDLSGVVRRSAKSTRAWQVFEWNNHRTEIFRTDFEEFVQNSPRPHEYPEAYRHARGVHLQCELEYFKEWVSKLREFGTRVIVWEPWGEFCTPEFQHVFKEYLPLVDAVSPNLEEGRALTGLEIPGEVALELVKLGARRVALRMGAEGSLVCDDAGFIAVIPAVQVVRIVDVTGAGNAYCGGLAVGLGETGDLLESGRWGAVSASFALEQFGALYPLDGVREKARMRLQILKGEGL